MRDIDTHIISDRSKKISMVEIIKNEGFLSIFAIYS